MNKRFHCLARRLRLAAVTLLLPLAGCAPKVYSSLLKSYPARSEKAPVHVYYLSDSLPVGTEIVGSVEVRDAGFAINCGFLRVVELATQATNRAGGNGLNITWHKEPQTLGSSCHQIAGDMLRLPGEALAATDSTASGIPTPSAALSGAATAPKSGSAANTAPETGSASRRPVKTGTALDARSGHQPFTLQAGVGYAYIYSTMEPIGEMTGNLHHGLNLQGAFQWCARTGIGAGLRYSGFFSSARFTDNPANGSFAGQRFLIRQHYIAPEVLLRQEKERWRFHESFGIGYAAYEERAAKIAQKASGVGFHIDLGVEYRLSKHVAAGLSVANYTSNFPSDSFLAPASEAQEPGQKIGISYLTINGGLRILF